MPRKYSAYEKLTEKNAAIAGALNQEAWHAMLRHINRAYETVQFTNKNLDTRTY